MSNRGIAALAYALTVVSGIACFAIRRDDDFVAFHAWQSIALGVTTVLAAVVLNQVPILGFVAAVGLIGLAMMASFYAAWRASRGDRAALPLVGDVAAELSARFRG